MSLRKGLIGALVVATLLCGVLIAWWNSLDEFAGHDLRLSADRSDYRIGDSIELVATVRPKGKAKIKVYRDRSKSFFLRVRHASPTGKPDMKDNSFIGRRWDGLPGGRVRAWWLSTFSGTVERIEISSGAPFSLRIKGHIYASSDGTPVFDFGEFGVFPKSAGGSFLIWGYWLPINPNPSDSLEDDTDPILVKVLGGDINDSGIKILRSVEIWPDNEINIWENLTQQRFPSELDAIQQEANHLSPGPSHSPLTR